MHRNHIFLIDSDSSGHRLSADGRRIGSFETLRAAQAAATHIAQGYVPSATLRFGLDFKWTLSDLETRTAVLECPAEAGKGEPVCG